MIRRNLQFFLIRQIIHLHRQLKLMRDSMRGPLEVLQAFLLGTQIRGVIVAVIGIIGLGTLGYMIGWGWSFIDALFMTMITITTVGFGEIHPLSASARLFTVLLILLSVTVVAYGLSSSVEHVASGALLENVNRRRQENRIQEMQNHFIVAGFGRVGQEIAAALCTEGVEFVVVEPENSAIERATQEGYLVIEGNATEDSTLADAGIERARGIICATGNDATNVYVVLSARGFNENLFIISRASDESSEAKLIRAGANRVISPYVISGRRMANLAVRPYVVDFLDITGTAGELEKTLEEIVIEEGSILGNRTLGEIDLRHRTGALILGLYRATGELLTSPSADTLLEPGTRMIVLGTRDELDVTEALSRNFMNLSSEEKEK